MHTATKHTDPGSISRPPKQGRTGGRMKQRLPTAYEVETSYGGTLRLGAKTGTDQEDKGRTDGKEARQGKAEARNRTGTGIGTAGDDEKRAEKKALEIMVSNTDT